MYYDPADLSHWRRHCMVCAVTAGALGGFSISIPGGGFRRRRHIRPPFAVT